MDFEEHCQRWEKFAGLLSGRDIQTNRADHPMQI